MQDRFAQRRQVHDRQGLGRLTRRDLLALGGAGLTTVSLAGCDLLSTAPTDQKGPGGDAGAKEAPQLAEQVAQGKLPPLAERLPEQPLVVQPVERAGVYGGEWRTSLLGLADAVWMSRTVGAESLLRWTPDFVEVIPNVATEYQVEDGGRAFVFQLRKGIRWSDGEPFTAEDVAFGRNDVVNNRELTPSEPANPAVVEVLEEYAFRIRFERPDGLFIKNQANDRDIIRRPFHYLKKYHKKYNPDLAAVVKEEDAKDWVSLFEIKAGMVGGASAHWQNPDLPTLYPWRTIKPAGESTRIVVERNPYYWKVDPDGRQLPYLDRVTFDVVNDSQVMLLKAMNGEIEMQDRNIGTPQNKPVLASNRESGGYDFFASNPTEMNTTGITLNLTHKDKIKREIFNSKDFRIGLSHAINRAEIIELVFQRQGEPWQIAPRPESKFHNEKMAKQFIEYDVDLANEHLDKAGFRRGSGGARLGPNGKPITFTLGFVTSWSPEWADVAELLKGYWGEVGIGINPTSMDRSLWLERSDANDFDASLWAGECGGDHDTVIRPMWFVHMDGTITPGPPWREWYHSQGKEGERPPEPIRKMMELYDQVKVTPEEAGQDALMRQILELNTELFPLIGISLPGPGYGVVKNNFHNVPAVIPVSAVFLNPGPTNPEQYFIQDV
ncbi:ABC transporter substrate-binding protein [Microlunatus speluncae]|uniref:ABC transporter substrate-binding protein n=1 Tax=Microlunatus speluncae TaxID=2594267 RepID=UPI0012662B05|nr:ABC transporter substrate-binding protein [Microlunatus speluncae]